MDAIEGRLALNRPAPRPKRVSAGKVFIPQTSMAESLLSDRGPMVSSGRFHQSKFFSSHDEGDRVSGMWRGGNCKPGGFVEKTPSSVEVPKCGCAVVCSK